MAKSIEQVAEREYVKASSSQRIENIEISPSSNGGFSVRKRCKAEEKSSKGDTCPAYVEPETLVFATVADLVEWIEETL